MLAIERAYIEKIITCHAWFSRHTSGNYDDVRILESIVHSFSIRIFHIAQIGFKLHVGANMRKICSNSNNVNNIVKC